MAEQAQECSPGFIFYRPYRRYNLRLYLSALWHWLLFSAFITFLYSAPKIPRPWFKALRKVAFAKTIFLAFGSMYGTTILPLLLNDQPWRTDFSLFAAGRFFLIYSICILFDYRDREYNKTVGIRSLITWLSGKNISHLFRLSLLLFAIFTCWLLLYRYSYSVIILLLIPGVVISARDPYAKKNFSDILYYFVLDGLALSSALTLF